MGRSNFKTPSSNGHERLFGGYTHAHISNITLVVHLAIVSKTYGENSSPLADIVQQNHQAEWFSIRNHQFWQQIEFVMPDIYRIRRVQLKKGEDEKPLCWRQMVFCFIGRYLHAGWINCFPKFNITDKAESTTVEIRIIKNAASFRPITMKKTVIITRSSLKHGE